MSLISQKKWRLRRSNRPPSEHRSERRWRTRLPLTRAWLTGFFRSGERGHSGSRNSEASPAIGGSSASQRLGRSVSQQGSKVDGGGDGKVDAGSSSGGGGRLASDNGDSNSRRGLSVSVVPYQISDSERDLDHSNIDKPEASNHRQGLRRSCSENDLSARNGYSATGIPKPTVPSNSSDQIDFSMLRNYANKLEECQKRQQDLLSEALLEQQRSRELSKIVKELLPEPRNDVIVDKPSQDGALRGCTERNGMSKTLSEEAERHVDDFISNVEDTDISPLDGERNDTSSSLGGIMKTQTTESQSPPGSVPLPAPADMDGVPLPSLQWETSIDASPAPCMDKIEPPAIPKAKTMLFDAARGVLAHAIGFISPPVAAGAVALVLLIRRRGTR